MAAGNPSLGLTIRCSRPGRHPGFARHEGVAAGPAVELGVNPLGQTLSTRYMENYHSAFLPGEYARLRPRSELEKLQQKLTGDPSQLGLHTVVPPNMAEFADLRVLITGRSYYHFGLVLYEFDGLPGHWPEAAIIDQQMGENDDPHNQPACLTYVATKSDDGQFVDIYNHDGRRFCSFRKHDPDSAVTDINRVARLRTRASFALRYGFDGVECDEHPATDN